MKSFSFTTDIEQLNRLPLLDFNRMLERGEVEESDQVQVEYDDESDILRAVIVNNGQQAGHAFDPVSMESDPELVKALQKLGDEIEAE